MQMSMEYCSWVDADEYGMIGIDAAVLGMLALYAI
jgi:hypothetical protein